MDCYSVLEVPPTASTETIRAAYRRLAQENHPDKNFESEEAATLRMSEINLAWEILKDPETRRINDEAQASGTQWPSGAETNGVKPGSYRPHPAAPVMLHVDSGCVLGIGYDGSNRLFIEFRSGGLYAYLGVPAAVYAALRHAKSKGRFVIYNIVNGPYRCKRVGA